MYLELPFVHQLNIYHSGAEQTSLRYSSRNHGFETRLEVRVSDDLFPTEEHDGGNLLSRNTASKMLSLLGYQTLEEKLFRS